MSKSPDAFRTISEVADWLGVQPHVLRFWESKFSQVKPVKRAGGRRYYRPSDMLLLGGIKQLLHEDGMTIKGAQKMLREKGVGEISELSAPLAVIEEDAATGEIIDASAEIAEPPAVAKADPEPDTPLPELPPVQDTDSGAQPELPFAQAGHTPEQRALAPESHRQELSRLPSFLHRDQPGSEVVDEDDTAEADIPAARVKPVDAPDPLPEDEIQVGPGILTRLAQLTDLPPGSAPEIAPVVAQLRLWLDRSGPTRPA